MNTKQRYVVMGVVAVILLAAIGYMTLWNNQSDTLSQQDNANSIQPANNQQSNADVLPNNTSNLKTYKSTAYGFEFQYPSTFTLSEDNATSKLFKSNDGHFWVNIENNPNKLGAEALKTEFYKNDGYGYQYQDSYLTVAGVKTYKQGRYDLGVIENYFVPKGDKTIKFNFEFNFDTPNQSLTQSKTNLINQIITTLKFTK